MFGGKRKKNHTKLNIASKVTENIRNLDAGGLCAAEGMKEAASNTDEWCSKILKGRERKR